MMSTYTIQPASAMRSHVNQIPQAAGIYALLLDDPAALDCALERAHLRLDSLRLGARAILYLGATEGSLRKRLKCHLSDDTYRSTFRMSLGAVLAEQLDLKVRPNTAVRSFGFEEESEMRLSAWIAANVSVAVRTSQHAMVEERALIAVQDPLLNITGRRHAPSAEAVMLLRRQVRGLPFERRCLH